MKTIRGSGPAIPRRALVARYPIQPLLFSIAAIVSAAAVPLEGRAERTNCWESRSSRILSYSDRHALGNFELSGISRNDSAMGQESLRFQCTGTFLKDDGGNKYNYYCEFDDSAGQRFFLKNADARSVDKLVYIGGIGKSGESIGVAEEFRGFPFNSDRILPACKQGENFQMP